MSPPPETSVSWSILVISGFLGFYAACVLSASSHQFRISKLIQQGSNSKPVKEGCDGEGLSRKKKREIEGKIFLKLFRSEQDKRKNDSHSLGVPGICG